MSSRGRALGHSSSVCFSDGQVQGRVEEGGREKGEGEGEREM